MTDPEQIAKGYQRPLPILMDHFPGAIHWDIAGGTDQRLTLRCTCGEVFRDTDECRLREQWAYHAMESLADIGLAVREVLMKEI